MKAKALVLEKQRELSLRDIDLPDQLGKRCINPAAAA